MSQKRFEFLHSCISFDDGTTRQERWKKRPVYSISKYFSIFCENCSKHIVPDEWLSLDETLFLMRNKISFKQYNKSKPSKYGLLFKSINAVRYSYTFMSLSYCGKPKDETSPFYIAGTENAAKYLVEKLEQHVDLQGRNLSFDRLYTSIPFAKWLLSRNITCIGTLQSNRKGIPIEVKHIKEREEFSYKYFWESDQKKLVLHSYLVRTKSTGLRNVLMLASLPPLLGTVKNDRKKNLQYTKSMTLRKVERILSTSEWAIIRVKQRVISGLLLLLLMCWIHVA